MRKGPDSRRTALQVRIWTSRLGPHHGIIMIRKLNKLSSLLEEILGSLDPEDEPLEINIEVNRE